MALCSDNHYTHCNSSWLPTVKVAKCRVLNRLNEQMKRSFQRQVFADEIVPASRLNRLRNQSAANIICDERIRRPHSAKKTVLR
jgi:hypothetical protein